MRSNAQRWARVVALALRQHGNITWQQLDKLGFASSSIARLVERGILHRVYRGVYAVGRPPQQALERAAAVVLACGPTAALSHRAALALWDLAGWPASPGEREVVVRQDRRVSGIRVHQCRTLLPRDLRKRHGIRVTSSARALLDCAPGLTDRALTRAVNDALRAKHLRPHHLSDLLLRCPTHPGTPKLRRFVDTDGGFTRSQLEDAFLALCRRHRLPTPRVNARVNGYEVDAYFDNERLVVELDGWDFHRSRDSFERDRARDAHVYEALGIPTIRITHERIERQPNREAARLERILARRVAELSRGSEPRSEQP